MISKLSIYVLFNHAEFIAGSEEYILIIFDYSVASIYIYKI